MIGRALTTAAREVRDTLANPPEWLEGVEWWGRKTHAGPRVDEQSALRSAAVAACVRAVSEDIGKVPCIIYERTDDRSRERRPTDSYAPALGLSPNPEMSAVEYWENLTAYGMLWGKGESYVNYKRNGTIELWPLPPNRTEPVREPIPTGTPGRYAPGPLVGINVTLDNGERRFLPWSNVVSMRAFGYSAKTPIQRHRETIGLALAGEEFGARFFGQGGSMGGFIRMPPEASAEQADRTEARYRAKHEGLDRAHLVGIMEGGAEWQEVGMPLRDAQYIDGRQFGVEEIARIFRVPLHKVQHLLRSTFSNIESQAIEYVVDAVSSWCIRHEYAHRIRLFGTGKFGLIGERYPEFLLDSLLRGNTEARYVAYGLAIQWGWMSRSEVRERENLPHIDALDDFLYPLNMVRAGHEADVQAVDPNVRMLAAILARHNTNGSGDNGLSDAVHTLLTA